MLDKQSDDNNNNHLQPVTRCGLHGQGFTVLPHGSNFKWPMCSKCFKPDAGEKSVLEVLRQSKRRRV